MSYFETGQVTRTILVDSDYNPTSTGTGGEVEVSGATFDELGNLNVIDSGAATTLGLISGYTNNTSANTAGIYNTIADVCAYTHELSQTAGTVDGTAPANAVQVAGVDSGGNLRVLETTTGGNLIINGHNTENTSAPNSLLQVGGRYDATGRTLDDGDSGALAVGSEGALITRMRCKEQSLADSIPNTNRELPLSCDGDYINFPTFGYVYNATGGVWDRIRGDTSGTQVTTGDGVELSVKTESSTTLNVKTAGTDTVGTTLENISAVVGQNDKDNSLPVTMANDQDPILVENNDSLRTKRANSQCYVVSHGKTESSVSNVSTLFIDNTSGLNTVYLYNIAVAVRNNQTSGNSTIRLVYGTGLTGGSSVTPENLKLGATTSSAVAVYNPTAVTSQTTWETMAVFANSSTTSTQSVYNFDFQEEFLEIPTGYCVGIEYALGGTGACAWSVSLRYYEG